MKYILQCMNLKCALLYQHKMVHCTAFSVDMGKLDEEVVFLYYPVSS